MGGHFSILFFHGSVREWGLAFKYNIGLWNKGLHMYLSEVTYLPSSDIMVAGPLTATDIFAKSSPLFGVFGGLTGYDVTPKRVHMS